MPKTLEELEKGHNDLGAALAQLSVEVKKAMTLPPDDERRVKLKADIEALGLFKPVPAPESSPAPAKKGLLAEVEALLNEFFE